MPQPAASLVDTAQKVSDLENCTKISVGDAWMLLPRDIANDLLGAGPLSLSWSTNDTCKGSILSLRGVVYRTGSEACLVSCGGIVVKLPTFLSNSTDVHIGVSTTRQTRLVSKSAKQG